MQMLALMRELFKEAALNALVAEFRLCLYGPSGSLSCGSDIDTHSVIALKHK